MATKKIGAAKIAKLNQNVRLMIRAVKSDVNALIAMKDKALQPRVRDINMDHIVM